MAHGEPRVPQERERLLHHRPDVLVRAVGVEEEQVHVGARRQLPAAVAAESDDRDLVLLAGQRRRELGGRELTGPAHDHVDEVAAPGGDLTPPEPEPVARAEALGLDLQEALERLRRLADAGAGSRDVERAVRAPQRVGEREVHGSGRESARPVPL